jgi:hypothetical protein
VALGQAEPPLQIEIVADLLERGLADEEAGEEAEHHPRHLSADRILRVPQPSGQLLELLPATWAILLPGFEGRGDFSDLLDIPSDRRLLGLDLA